MLTYTNGIFVWTMGCTIKWAKSPIHKFINRAY